MFARIGWDQAISEELYHFVYLLYVKFVAHSIANFCDPSCDYRLRFPESLLDFPVVRLSHIT